MGIQFFGEFLIDRWVITRGQLLEALELQEYRNTKFGQLAVQKGYLTEDEVRRINTHQRSEDLRFGDLAVKLGLMSPDQIRTVLTLQKNDYLFLGESLLELGHVTEDILERELAIFEEEQAKFAHTEVSVPTGTASADLLAACVDLTRKLFLRVTGLLVKVGDGEVLGADALADLRDRTDFHLLVSVPLISGMPVRYLLCVSSEVAVVIASKILGEDATRESEAIVEDAVCEFCNMVCGNVAARLAQQGSDVEIGPPESHSSMPPAEAGRVIVRYPIKVAEGKVELRFLAPPTAAETAG